MSNQHPRHDVLLHAARHNPSKIDALLAAHISSPTFPSELAKLIDRHYRSHDDKLACPPGHYATCVIYGLLIGRPYSLLSTSSIPSLDLADPHAFPIATLPAELRFLIWEQYEANEAQKRKYWEAMTDTFIHAFWRDYDFPDHGDRYIAGVLILICGIALSQTQPSPQGLGQGHPESPSDSPICSVIWEPDVIWNSSDLRAAVFRTEDWPRDSTVHELVKKSHHAAVRKDIPERYREEVPGHLPSEVLGVMGAAREHLRSGKRHWTPEEVTKRFLDPLFEDRVGERREWEEKGHVTLQADV